MTSISRVLDRAVHVRTVAFRLLSSVRLLCANTVPDEERTPEENVHFSKKDLPDCSLSLRCPEGNLETEICRVTSFNDSVLGVYARAARSGMSRTQTLWNCFYWLDLGNNAASGQFVLGQPENSRNKSVELRLPTAAELFPE